MHNEYLQILWILWVKDRKLVVGPKRSGIDNTPWNLIWLVGGLAHEFYFSIYWE